MTIQSTKKLLVLAASVMLLALGAAPAGFAGEDDGPTANGEQIGSTFGSSNGSNGSTSNGSTSNGTRSSSSSGSTSKSSAKSGVKGAQHHAAVRSDTTKARGAAQTGFGGMADTPGGSILFTLLIGLGGAAAVFGARGLSALNGSNR